MLENPPNPRAPAYHLKCCRRLPLLHEACAAVDVAAVVAALPMAASIGEATSDGRTALHALAAGVQGPMQASPGRAIAATLVQTGLQVGVLPHGQMV